MSQNQEVTLMVKERAKQNTIQSSTKEKDKFYNTESQFILFHKAGYHKDNMEYQSILDYQNIFQDLIILIDTESEPSLSTE